MCYGNKVLEALLELVALVRMQASCFIWFQADGILLKQVVHHVLGQRQNTPLNVKDIQ